MIFRKLRALTHLNNWRACSLIQFSFTIKIQNSFLLANAAHTFVQKPISGFCPNARIKTRDFLTFTSLDVEFSSIFPCWRNPKVTIQGSVWHLVLMFKTFFTTSPMKNCCSLYKAVLWFTMICGLGRATLCPEVLCQAISLWAPWTRFSTENRQVCMKKCTDMWMITSSLHRSMDLKGTGTGSRKSLRKVVVVCSLRPTCQLMDKFSSWICPFLTQFLFGPATSENEGFNMPRQLPSCQACRSGECHDRLFTEPVQAINCFKKS